MTDKRKYLQFTTNLREHKCIIQNERRPYSIYDMHGTKNMTFEYRPTEYREKMEWIPKVANEISLRLTIDLSSKQDSKGGS